MNILIWFEFYQMLDLYFLSFQLQTFALVEITKTRRARSTCRNNQLCLRRKCDQIFQKLKNQLKLKDEQKDFEKMYNLTMAIEGISVELDPNSDLKNGDAACWKFKFWICKNFTI